MRQRLKRVRLRVQERFTSPNLSGQRAPGRYCTGDRANKHLLCFGPGDAFAELQKIVQVINQTRVVPANLAVPADTDIALLYRTLRHLLRYWSGVPPERKHPGYQRRGRITVVRGYEEVLACLTHEDIDCAGVPNDEEWTVANESKDGFGCLVLKSTISRLTPGELVAFRSTGATSWGLGVVRRARLDQKDHCYVGVQKLALSGCAVMISVPYREDEERARAILMMSDDSVEQQATLLMPLKRFSYSQ